MGRLAFYRASSDTECVMQPNAPNRFCDSCGAQFRNKYVKCPACRSVDIAPIVYKQNNTKGIPKDREGLQKVEDAIWKKLEAKMGFVAMPPNSDVNRPTFVCRKCQNAFRSRLEACPECGSSSTNRIKVPGVVAHYAGIEWMMWRVLDRVGRHLERYTELLARKETWPDTERAMQPNAPNRFCDSCGAQFRNKYVKCPACRSMDIAPIVYGMIHYDWKGDEEQGVEDTVWKKLEAKMGFVAMSPTKGVNRPTFMCRKCQNAFRPHLEQCPECSSHNISWTTYGLTGEHRTYTGECPGGYIRLYIPTKVCGDCGHGFG